LPFRTKDVQPEESLEYYLSSYQWLDAVNGPPENYFEQLSRNCALLLDRGIAKEETKKEEAAPVQPPVQEQLPPPTIKEEPKSIAPKSEEPAPKTPNEEPVVPPAPKQEPAPPKPPVMHPPVTENPVSPPYIRPP